LPEPKNIVKKERKKERKIRLSQVVEIFFKQFIKENSYINCPAIF
jgi:hypothetical protein